MFVRLLVLLWLQKSTAKQCLEYNMKNEPIQLTMSLSIPFPIFFIVIYYRTKKICNFDVCINFLFTHIKFRVENQVCHFPGHDVWN